VLLRTVRFFAVILTALALVPAGAHFFELPNKIRLSQEQYFTVQGIYRGWALFGIVLLGDLGLNDYRSGNAQFALVFTLVIVAAFIAVARFRAILRTWKPRPLQIQETSQSTRLGSIDASTALDRSTLSI
jgi:hypothetical protein